MRDIYEVLREKEVAMLQIRQELEALRSVTPLLSDERSAISLSTSCGTSGDSRVSELREALRTAAPLLADEAEEMDPAIRARLVEAGEIDSKLGRGSRISRQLRHFAAPLLGEKVEFR